MSEPSKPRQIQRIEAPSTSEFSEFREARCTFCDRRALSQDRDGVKRCWAHQDSGGMP